MSEVRQILAKELRDLHQSGRMAAAAAAVLITVPLTTLALLLPFSERGQELRRTANLMKLADPASEPYSAVRYQGFRIPSVTELFNEGVAGDFPVQFSLSRNALADPVAPQVFDRPLLSSLPVNDLRFVFELLFPLLAIALSFSTVSGEREAGTLALLCSHPIARRSIILGKMLAGVGALTALLLLAHAAAGITIMLAGASTPAGFLLFLGLHFAASFLWTLVFFLLGVLASTALSSSNQAAMSLFSAWALLVLVAPAALPSLATSWTSYTSEQMQYEEIWRQGAGVFSATQQWASEMDLSFSEGMIEHLARQPAWSEIALSLTSGRRQARLYCVSDGTVVVRTEDQRLLRTLEEGLPALVKKQDEAGRQISEVRQRRFARLLEEAERLNALTVLSPASAYDQITASLAGSDAAAYLTFIEELNQRKETYFTSLQSLSDFSSRRFFTLSAGAKSPGRLSPPVWERSDDIRSPARPRWTAWLSLLGLDLLLALSAGALFSTTPPR